MKSIPRSLHAFQIGKPSTALRKLDIREKGAV